MPDHKFLDVISYFEKLATEHVAIKHGPFNKHFFRLEFDELMTGLHEEACFPAVVLESYTFTLDDARADNGIKHRDGAFMLIDMVPDASDLDAVHQTWEKLEEIGDDFFARIQSEKRLPSSPFRSFKLSSVSATLITNEPLNTVGIRYTYEIESSFALDMNPDKWDIQ